MKTYPPYTTLSPYTTLFRSIGNAISIGGAIRVVSSQNVIRSLRRNGMRASAYAAGVPITRPSSVLMRSEEHTSELQSRENLVCRLLLEKKKINNAQKQCLNN